MTAISTPALSHLRALEAEAIHVHPRGRGRA